MFWADVVLTALYDADGTLVGFSKVTRDLTDRRRAEEALRQRAIELEEARNRAERSDQVKSAFLASMSHELRTPLNAIINFTQFVVAGDMGEVNAEQKDLLSDVVVSGKHLLALINDVLDMSKIESGALTLFVEEHVDVKTILDSALATTRALIKPEVQLVLNLPEQLPSIRADRLRILQILLNILSNAAKFTTAGAITVNIQAADTALTIAVSDTGPGIAPDDQAAVFRAFAQTSTGLRQGGGSGLGMPIAMSLVKAHGGRLWLDSTVGQGTTFSVELPIASPDLLVIK